MHSINLPNDSVIIQKKIDQDIQVKLEKKKLNMNKIAQLPNLMNQPSNIRDFLNDDDDENPIVDNILGKINAVNQALKNNQ